MPSFTWCGACKQIMLGLLSVIDWPASGSGNHARSKHLGFGNDANKNALGLATMFGSGMVARPKRLGSSIQKKTHAFGMIVRPRRLGQK